MSQTIDSNRSVNVEAPILTDDSEYTNIPPSMVGAVEDMQDPSLSDVARAKAANEVLSGLDDLPEGGFKASVKLQAESTIQQCIESAVLDGKHVDDVDWSSLSTSDLVALVEFLDDGGFLDKSGMSPEDLTSNIYAWIGVAESDFTTPIQKLSASANLLELVSGSLSDKIDASSVDSMREGALDKSEAALSLAVVSSESSEPGERREAMNFLNSNMSALNETVFGVEFQNIAGLTDLVASDASSGEFKSILDSGSNRINGAAETSSQSDQSVGSVTNTNHDDLFGHVPLWESGTGMNPTDFSKMLLEIKFEAIAEGDPIKLISIQHAEMLFDRAYNMLMRSMS